MTSFIFLYRGWAAPASAAALRSEGRLWGAWFRQLTRDGHLIDRGFPLSRIGKLVKSPAKRAATTREKYPIGGYSIVSAKNLAHAIELTWKCPNFLTGGFVEVRPLLTSKASAS